MADTFQIVFLKAGDGTDASAEAVAQVIATKAKVPVDRLLASIRKAPFVYRKGLPQDKAEAVSRALNKLGAQTLVQPDGAPLPEPAAPAAPEPTPAAGGGFDFGGQPAGAEAAPAAGGGFDFGGQPAGAEAAPAAGGGFDFGGQPAEPAQDGGFGPPAGLAESGPAPAAPGPLGQEAESPGAATDDGAFAPLVQAKKEEQDLGVERNLDYAEDQDSGGGGVGPPVSDISCPRCGHTQPPARECASCGVVMAKAAQEAPEGAPTSRRARPTSRAAPSAGAKLKPILISLLVLAVAGGVAWVSGALNPLMLKLKAMKDPQVRAYGVEVGRPLKGVSYLRITDPEKAQEVQDTFVNMSEYIGSSIERLGTLDNMAAFDQEAGNLQQYVDAYLGHDMHALRKRVLDMTSPYYPVTGVGVRLGDITYLTKEEIAASGLEGVGVVKPVLHDIQIQQGLKQAREQVRQRESQLTHQARQAEVNVDLDEPLSGTLSERWAWQDGESAAWGVDQRGLTLMGSDVDFKSGRPPLLFIPEPTVDYSVELTIAGTAQGQARGGLVVYQNPNYLLEFARTDDRGQVVQIFSTLGGRSAPGYSAPAAPMARVKIDKRRNEYSFHTWDARRRQWQRLDRMQPEWDPRIERKLGIAAVAGKGTFVFSGFSVRIR